MLGASDSPTRFNRRVMVHYGKLHPLQVERAGPRWVVMQIGDLLTEEDRVVAGPFWRKRTALVHLEIHRALEGRK